MATATTAERTQDEASQYMAQAKAIASLPPDIALMKMENENFQAMAVARPRDMTAIKEELEVTLKEFPILATEAIYNKPVGFVWLIHCKCGNEYEVAKNEKPGNECPRCDKYDPKQLPRKVKKFARDLSIRAAEQLAESYGFNRVQADLSPTEREGHYKISATFVDFQKGRIWQDSGILSQWYKSHSGRMEKTNEDRFFNVTAKGEKSKYIREVINRCVNQGLKAWFYDRCEQIQEKELLNEGTVKKIITEFATKGVTEEMIEQLAGGRTRSNWTMDDKKALLGIWNALKSGETTVREIFKDDEPPTANGSTPPGAVSAADLTKGAPPDGNAQGAPTGEESQVDDSHRTTTKPAKGQKTLTPREPGEDG